MARSASSFRRAQPVGILRLGAEYEIYDFGIPEGLQIPDRLQSINAIIGLDTKLSDSLLIRLEMRPGFYSADDIEGGDFNMPFILGGTYLYSSTLQFVFGVGVDWEREYPCFPAAVSAGNSRRNGSSTPPCQHRAWSMR